MKLFANILLIMSMMLLLVSSVSALTANSYYYSGDGSTSVNSIISKVDINNSNLLYTGMADHDIEYPTVCDAIGDGYDQYFSYENHVITAHAIVDGQLQEIAYLELADPSYTINDVHCLSSVSDSLNRDMVVVNYNTGSNTIIDIYALFDNSGEFILQDIGELASFTQHTPFTEVHCSEWLQSSQPFFLCAYAGTNDKIYTYGSTSSEQREITVTGLNVDPSDVSTIIDFDAKLSTIGVSNADIYELIAVDYESHEAPNTGVLFIDIDQCSGSTCTLDSSDYVRYNVTKDDSGSDSSHDGHTISNFQMDPRDSTVGQYRDNLLFDQYCAVFVEKESENFPTPSLRSDIVYVCDGVEIWKEQVSAFSTDSHTSGFDSEEVIISTHPMVITDLDLDGNNEYCTDSLGKGYDSGNTGTRYFQFACMEIDGVGAASVTALTSGTNNGVGTVGDILVGAGKLYDSTKNYLIVYDDQSNTYYAMNSTGSLTEVSQITYTGKSNAYTTDSNRDGIQELYLSTEDGPRVIYYFNADPDVIGIQSSLNNDGLGGYYNPSKVNTTVTFTAKECLSSNNLNDCTYLNQNPLARLAGVNQIQERLCSTFDGSTEVCGDWSYDEPSISHVFNETGTYQLDFNMYTRTNTEEVAQVLSIDSFVVSENDVNPSDYVNFQDLDGFDNVEEVEEEQEDRLTNLQQSESGIPVIFNILNDHKTTIFSLLVIVGLIATMAAQGIRNPIVLIFAGIIAAIGLIVVGLLNAVVLVYVGVAGIILVILSFTIFKTRD